VYIIPEKYFIYDKFDDEISNNGFGTIPSTPPTSSPSPTVESGFVTSPTVGGGFVTSPTVGGGFGTPDRLNTGYGFGPPYKTTYGNGFGTSSTVGDGFGTSSTVGGGFGTPDRLNTGDGFGPPYKPTTVTTNKPKRYKLKNNANILYTYYHDPTSPVPAITRVQKMSNIYYGPEVCVNGIRNFWVESKKIVSHYRAYSKQRRNACRYTYKV
jgi:hypothetical protein